MLGFGTAKGGGVFRIEIAQIIPATAGPLRHGVGFASGTIGQIHPIFCASQRRLAVWGWLVIIQWWRQYGQGGGGQCFVVPLFIAPALPNNWERLAPVALAAEKPVAKFVIYGPFAQTFGFQPGGDLFLCFIGGQTVQGDFIAG